MSIENLDLQTTKDIFPKMDFKKEVHQVITELQSADNSKDCGSTSSSGLYGSLIIMRTTLIKSKDSLAQLVHAGCIKLLLNLLTPPTIKGKWLKTVDIVLSILANLCLEEDVWSEVISNRGLSIIVEATISTDTESIHNRGVRAVANLVQHVSHSEELFELEFPAFVAKRLMETKEKECKLTYLRAIRLFGQSSSQVKLLVEKSRSVHAVAVMLQETDGKLKQKALRILSEFSALRCCPAFVEQMLAANTLEELVQSVEDSDSEICFFSLSIIFKLGEHENIRPPLGAAGLISSFMRLLNLEKSHINHVSILNVLCLCSKEAVNRHKLLQEGTLELFISALRSGTDTGRKFSVLHDRIISILINFIYNDECFAKLLDLDLVSVLMDHLKRVCNFCILKENWSDEIACASEVDKEIKELGKSSRHDDDNDSVSDNNESTFDKFSTDRMMDTSVKNLNVSWNSRCFKVTKENDLKLQDTESSVTLEVNRSLSPCDDIEQEINGIEMIPSLGVSSRDTFSIDSPTYQLEQHSWRLEDHTSGITCKNFSSDHFEDHISSKPLLEGSKFSPYSPLSAGASYYSPAYPSPAHSLGSSPRHSGFQTSGSFNLGSQSPQSSPAWSLASSYQLEDTSSVHRMSPNTEHFQTPHQGQFSPLINPYPASPPVIANEESEILGSPDEFNSHSSLISNSNKSVDSPEDVFGESPHPLISIPLPLKSGSRQVFAQAALPEETQDLIYSTSEEETEEQNTDRCKRLEQGDKNVVKIGHSKFPKIEISNGAKYIDSSGNKQRKERRLTLHPKTTSTESDELFSGNYSFSNHNPVLIQPDSQTSNIPIIRLNHDPCTSSRPLKALETNSKVEKYPLTSEIKQGSSKALSARSLVERGVNNDKTVITKQFSFPSSSPLPLSPIRKQFDLPSQSPSMSSFSRYSNSSYSSPIPYWQLRIEKSSSTESEEFHKKSNGERKISSPVNEASTDASLHSQTAVKTISTSVGNDDLPGSEASNKNSERVRKILRTTESNILILLSRVSLKTNPTSYLVKFPVLSTLFSYLSVAPRPFQRAVRFLSRLCKNPLCFESLLLKQAPALIVKNLILNQDGSFPAFFFKNPQGGDRLSVASTCRKTNFDEMFPSSQNSDSGSDFGLKMEFEFGGDAYSRLNFTHFPPAFPNRSLSIDSHCARDNPEVYQLSDTGDNVDDRIKSRVGMGVSLMKVISSLALSKYGDGEIQRLWLRGGKSEKLACAISLLHLPLGCGPLQRYQIAFKHNTLQEVLPLLFVEGIPLIRESVVTALSLQAHLLGMTKQTPKIFQLKPCPDSCRFNLSCSLPNKCDVLDSSLNKKSKTITYMMKEKAEDNIDSTNTSVIQLPCIYECISADMLNLNLILTDDQSGEKKIFRACKEVLMKKSDVFSAMLGGGYMEAGKVDIELSDVSLSGFEYVIHYLHGCGTGCFVLDSVIPNTLTAPCDISSSEISIVSSSSHEVIHLKSEEEKTMGNQPNFNLNGCEVLQPEVDACVVDSGLNSQEISQDKSARLGIDANTEVEGSADNQVLTSQCAAQLPGHTTSLSKNDGIDSENSNPAIMTSSDVKEDSLITHIHSILDRCVDILTVADRFLLQDLIKYLTSLLSHSCLSMSTSQEILYVASYYKLDSLALDCVLEVLLSQTSKKDIASLFLTPGLDSSEIRETVVSALLQIFTHA